MSSLSDKMVEIITSEGATKCEVKGCRTPHTAPLSKTTIAYLVEQVPYPQGTSGMTAIWEREKVVRNLRCDLQGLKPRIWSAEAEQDLAKCIGRHDWYS